MPTDAERRAVWARLKNYASPTDAAIDWIIKLQGAIGTLDEHNAGCNADYGYRCKCGLNEYRTDPDYGLAEFYKLGDDGIVRSLAPPRPIGQNPLPKKPRRER